MNIAREIGSVISGLLAPQASPSVQRLDKSPARRAGTSTQDQAGPEKTPREAQGSDRISLSSAALSLANSKHEQSAAATATAPANLTQSGPLLALPYSPSTTSTPQQQAGEESPATRQLVRTAYGNSNPSDTLETFAHPRRIDFHA